ncbi:MAG TPA: TonB-dependent receptor [Thermoanaerobaculia bacterium]|nr:TonB-dependent receptor [Thermoanaerobaculia bacterium]
MRWLVPVAFAVVLCVAPLAAQTTAALTGTVTQDDAPLSGATVTVTSPALQGARTTTTSATGAFLFAALPPGEYSVRVGHAVRRATLSLSQTTRVDIVLATTIVFAPVAPEIASKPVATSFPLESIERLPVPRNQNATAQLAPGVTANTLSNGQLSISGGPSYDNLVIVNGVVVNENTRGQMRPMYVEDAIDETTVLTGAISAEYGRFTGGVVNTITKQGGNELRASLRDSLSNPRWSATSPANESREDSLNHVFEATLGGPLQRDRLWFFTAGRWAKNDTARQTIAIPAQIAGTVSPPSPQLSYSESNDQKRYEAKLTGRVAANHTLIASYFGIDTKTENSRFANNIYDAASLTSRNEPETLGVIRYEAIAGNNVMAEAQLSRRTMSLRSGATARDAVGGTLLLDRANGNARFNAPSLCGVCESEQRNNDDAQLKLRGFFDAAGTHDMVLGVDRFTEHHLLDDRQSGSDFALFVTRAQWKDGVIYPVITPTTANGGGTFLRWQPVLVAARENELRTSSLFANDTWTVGRWSLAAGARWDRNHARDSDGTVTADDRRLSPRLALQFDVSGDGRHRLSASYGEYASRVADAIASSNQTAGRAASIDFAYRGPAINNNALNVPLADAIAMVFAYFNGTQGGTDNRAAQNLRANGTRDIPGYATYFDGTLSMPHVREMTLGYGMQFGVAGNGVVRADLVSREWRDFYTLSVTPQTRRTTTPLGIPADLALVRNTNDIERTYRGVHLQARWSNAPLDFGALYTWAKLRGNDEGETANGPIANVTPSLYYPEFLDYERNNPIGYLRGDQRHRLRAWAGLTLGRFEVSLLQTYDSGVAYSITSSINVTRYPGAPANPGYNSIPNGRYFFTGRGELRADDVTSTNLALRYTIPLGRASVFLHGDLLNAFDEDALADPQRIGTGISTAANAATLQPFDPRTTTPVEGVHYTRAANFGQALNNLAYQTPRTYRFSVGAKF